MVISRNKRKIKPLSPIAILTTRRICADLTLIGNAPAVNTAGHKSGLSIAETIAEAIDHAIAIAREPRDPRYDLYIVECEHCEWSARGQEENQVAGEGNVHACASSHSVMLLGADYLID